ncbi:hypothetical protein TanjilG_19404 [Lupinus angustifolius]|uniref:AP2/ERF domain-containing protein n=1 Tax=Lupinus angustifolius TaxID=3871 RepID=A0A4P1R522_LUPAN|nr:hypothetical protein TanjilG_19404 [Lupinus angustifolius]
MGMFDLNVDIFHIDSDSTCAKMLQLQSFPSKISHSGASKSSVVINPTEEDSSKNSSPLFFDVIKQRTDVNERNKEHENIALEQEEVTTMTLFPATVDRGGRVSDMNKRKTQWLNLSISKHDEQDEPRIFHQKQPQIKKRRRGPRSQTSQFRGVTFYRRTGRWESHIW